MNPDHIDKSNAVDYVLTNHYDEVKEYVLSKESALIQITKMDDKTGEVIGFYPNFELQYLGQLIKNNKNPDAVYVIRG